MALEEIREERVKAVWKWRRSNEIRTALAKKRYDFALAVKGALIHQATTEEEEYEEIEEIDNIDRLDSILIESINDKKYGSAMNSLDAGFSSLLAEDPDPIRQNDDYQTYYTPGNKIIKQEPLESRHPGVKLEPKLEQPKMIDPSSPTEPKSNDSHPGGLTKLYLDSAKGLYHEIPKYDNETDILKVQTFTRLARQWAERIRKANFLSETEIMDDLQMKLGHSAITTFHQARTEAGDKGQWTIDRYLEWLEEEKKVDQDSAAAREELSKVQQFEKGSSMSVESYFLKLVNINNRIDHHPLKHRNFCECFIKGLDKRIKRDTERWYYRFLADNDNEVPTTRRLKNEAEIQMRGLPLTIETKEERGHKVTSVRRDGGIGQSMKGGNSHLRVSQISNQINGPYNHERHRYIRLSENPELRLLLRSEARCLFCREKGCKGASDETAQTCPILLRAKAEHPERYFSRSLSTDPPVALEHEGGEVDSEQRENKKIFINNGGSNPKVDQLMDRAAIIAVGSPSMPGGGMSPEPTLVSPPSITTQGMLFPNDLSAPVLDETSIEKPDEYHGGSNPKVDQLMDRAAIIAVGSPSMPGGGTSPEPTLVPPPSITAEGMLSPNDLSVPVLDETPIEKWAPPEDRRLFLGTINGNIQAKVLDDTGCDGMVMGRRFAMSHDLVVRGCESRKIEVADGRSQVIDEEVEIIIQIGRWRKRLRLSVADVDEDIIFGVPFRKTINIIFDDWSQKRLVFRTRKGMRHTWYGAAHKWGSGRIQMIRSDQFLGQFRNDEEVLAINLKDVYEGLEPFNEGLEQLPLKISSLTGGEEKTKTELIEEFLEKQRPEISEVLKPFLDSVFTEPPHFDDIPKRPEDMKINLKDGRRPKNQPLRRFSVEEDRIIREKVDELLAKGFIRPSSSEYGANLLFSKKKDGGLRMCIDYRQINLDTIPERTPLPSHADLRDKVRGSTFLSKVDVRDAFHMIRIDAPDCHKSAFKTRFGLFEYTVCPFGLTNSPAVFMRMMNRVFGDLIDKGLSYYVDDLMLYSKTLDDHVTLIQIVFERLRDNNLHVKLTKCEFAVSELEFCGVKVSSSGYSISEPQVDAMCDYPSFDPTKDKTKKYAQRLLGSVRWFADFIPELGNIAQPLFDLTKDSNSEPWGILHQSIWRILQFHLTTAPTLKYFDPSLETRTHTDASKFAIGGWLGQVHPDGKEYVVSYWSRKMISAELNYPVHEQEFLALHQFVRKFRTFLHGVPFTAFVDHKAMERLQTQQFLSPRQVRWIQELQEFMPKIQYIDGPSNTFADWLSRRPDFEFVECPECNFRISVGGGVTLRSSTNKKPKSKTSDNLNGSRVSSTRNETGVGGCNFCNYSPPEVSPFCSSISTSPLDPSSLLDLGTPAFKAAQDSDTFCQKLQDWSEAGAPAKEKGFFKSFKRDSETGLWFRNGNIIIPKGDYRLRILEYFHDRVDHGHFGAAKTLYSISRSTYWPEMIEDVKNFVKSCDPCQKNKRSSNTGLLQPLEISDERFESLNIDLASLPMSENQRDTVLVIHDRCSKISEFVPTTSDVTAKTIALLIYRHWYLKGYGFPKELVSDRDPRFVSDIWNEFCSLVGIKRAMSTARHQQTDGGAEVVIRILKDILKKVTNHKQDDWVEKLPMVQFAINNSIHSSTGFTPFYLAHAFEPISFPDTNPKKPSLLSSVFRQYQEDLEEAYLTMWRSQETMIRDYDKRHSAPNPEDYTPGKLVLLDREGISWQPTSAVSSKLLPIYIGPFKIKRFDEKKRNVELELPRSMKCHNVFHLSKVKPYVRTDEYFKRDTAPTEPPPEVDEFGEENYYVDKVLDTRIFRRKRQFLIRWEGYDSSHDSWEPLDCLEGCQEKLAEYLVKYPISNFSLVDAFSARGGVVKNRSLRASGPRA